MTYAHRNRFYPQPGQVAELQAVLEEFTRELQGAGSNAGLTACRYGPESPYFLFGSWWNSLVEREQALPKIAPINRKYGPRIGPLSRQHGTAFLWERLAHVNPSSPRWILSNELSPALGEAGALRTLLLDSMKTAEAQGQSQTLYVVAAGPEAGLLVRNFNFASLADLEAFRAGRDVASPYAKQRDALLSRPFASSLHEMLVERAS